MGKISRSSKAVRSSAVGLLFAILGVGDLGRVQAADLARGEKIYGMMCAECHGEEGRGDGPMANDLTKKPAAYTKPGFFDNYPDAELRKVVIEGSKPMRSFRASLSDRDVDNVIAYIKTFASGAKKK